MRRSRLVNCQSEREIIEAERERLMRKFDPWPVFFRREWSRNWPFLIGFAVTGTIITKLSLGLTEEDAKNSPFVQRHKR
ncbi:ATP synthase small subunit 6, mitochondrial-like isoform X3 [Actinidia eriantha]|uniref:ATP synthase small subunit 6, mitochondrial-like isoform X2 n=1 Tax=Actinidia eriantha TaxID=165200 RepID=UPI00258397E3|nr:ATP synthase small subunit 6, mitochondrial-like isoform X2 [Actinidia eriantha]XP_057499880.1 ATP synthase small subunit 6, mitochondrial-like isoform X3 [Actinidia eriantha]